MKTIEYHDLDDRSRWGSGPWDAETLDKKQWRDEATGLPCMIRRGPLGSWCGYVGIEDPDHPWFGKDSGAPGVEVEVHGGLTFSSFCQEHGEGEEGHVICHVVEDGEVDRVWWLGFDTAHGWDVVPGMTAAAFSGFGFGERGTYKDIAYVTAEVEALAQQVKEKGETTQ